MRKKGEDMKPVVEFADDKKEEITFQFNGSIKTGTYANGSAWYLYSVLHKGTEKVIFATEDLNALLKSSEPLKDKTVTIEKISAENYSYYTLDGVSVDDLEEGGVKPVNLGSQGNSSTVDVLNSIIDLCRGALNSLEKPKKETKNEPNKFDQYTPKWVNDEVQEEAPVIEKEKDPAIKDYDEDIPF